MNEPLFIEFPKIARLQKPAIITEKLDGSNAQVIVTNDGEVFAGSRSRLITPGKQTDNYGFAAWVAEHAGELVALGPGNHYGEWWGLGINRGYGLTEKRFSLFNHARYKTPGSLAIPDFDATDPLMDSRIEIPACCSMVPLLTIADFSTQAVDSAMFGLAMTGSVAAPGFMEPEGIVIYHTASRTRFKHLFDSKPKTQKEQTA